MDLTIEQLGLLTSVGALVWLSVYRYLVYRSLKRVGTIWVGVIGTDEDQQCLAGDIIKRLVYFGVTVQPISMMDIAIVVDDHWDDVAHRGLVVAGTIRQAHPTDQRQRTGEVLVEVELRDHDEPTGEAKVWGVLSSRRKRTSLAARLVWEIAKICHENYQPNPVPMTHAMRALAPIKKD